MAVGPIEDDLAVVAEETRDEATRGSDHRRAVDEDSEHSDGGEDDAYQSALSMQAEEMSERSDESEPQPSDFVYMLLCGSCSDVVCRRGMRVHLCADTCVTLFSTDFRPIGVVESAGEREHGTCACRVRDVSCRACAHSIGYHVIQPCQCCGSADHNEHYWQLYSTAVNAEPRLDSDGASVTWAQKSMACEEWRADSDEEPMVQGPQVRTSLPSDDANAIVGYVKEVVACDANVTPRSSDGKSVVPHSRSPRRDSTIAGSLLLKAEPPEQETTRTVHVPCQEEEHDDSCPICQQTMVSPHILPCNHAGCLRCLTRAIDLRRSCPCCRRPAYCTELVAAPWLEKIQSTKGKQR